MTMGMQGQQAKYRRLYQNHAAWKLLRANNSPYILAFIESLFASENEQRFETARLLLTEHIDQCRENGVWETETSAKTYLAQWIQQGWLREMDNQVSKTDACEVALKFCQRLEDRGTSTTASHLRIVQDALAHLLVAVSPSIGKRLELLLTKKAEVDAEIDSLRAGDIVELNESEKRERIKEFYQLASVLTGDFRRVEDEIRQMNKDLRIKIIEGESGRAEVLRALLDQESNLYSSDAGRAFESFFNLLCDQDRTVEFRDQIKSILALPIADHLNSLQRQFLAKLLTELNHESERIFRVRRRTEEGIKSYIESGAAAESEAVDQMIAKLERKAVELRDAGIEPNQPTDLKLYLGSITPRSPESLRLRDPADKIDTSGVIERKNSREPSAKILASLDAVEIHAVARKLYDILIEHGPLTVAELVKANPITSGLEQLIAYFRIAKAVRAAELNDQESVVVADKSGTQLQVKIPKLLLDADLFPHDIENMTI